MLAYAPNPLSLDVTMVLGLLATVVAMFRLAAKEVTDEQVSAAWERKAERRRRKAAERNAR